MSTPNPAATPVRTPGRVLRVKAGYNPNSSSVASELGIYLFAAVGAGVLTIAGLSVAEIIRKKLGKDAPKPEPPAADAKP